MAHERQRHILNILAARAKLWPVLGILGMRQSGKSTLLRNQIQNDLYISLDSPSVRKSAEAAPELFLRDALANHKTLTIDEIQKVPDLFDTIKLMVDEKRRPGTFYISGSTQFSTRVGIRESLTGRIGLQRLYPLTTAELFDLPFCKPLVDLVHGKPPHTSKLPAVDILKSARLGGMPGHCFLRNEKERKEYLRGWLETTCYRDASQITSPRAVPVLLDQIVRVLGSKPFQDIATIAAELAIHARKVSSQLAILEELFVVARIEPSSLGTGKALFYIADSGFSATLGCGDLNAIKLWLVNELQAQFEYAGEGPLRVNYFKSKNKSIIDFVLPDYKTAIQVSIEESVHEYMLRAAKSFTAKNKDWKVYIASPASLVRSLGEGMKLIPWTNLC